MLKCMNCGKELREGDINLFSVNVTTCAIKESIGIGKAPVNLCNDCYRERGKPRRVHLGRIHYEKDFETYTLDVAGTICMGCKIKKECLEDGEISYCPFRM